MFCITKYSIAHFVGIIYYYLLAAVDDGEIAAVVVVLLAAAAAAAAKPLSCRNPYSCSCSWTDVGKQCMLDRDLRMKCFTYDH